MEANQQLPMAGQMGEMTGKRPKKTFWGEINLLYLDCTGDYTGEEM